MLEEHMETEFKVALQPRRLAALFLLIIAVGAVTSLLSLGLWEVGGLSLSDIQSGIDLSLSERMIMRAGLIINHAGMFLLPGIIFAYIYHKRNLSSVLWLNNRGGISGYVLWGLAILCSYPFIAGVTQFNMSLDFPEWMNNAQDDSFALLSNALTMESPLEFLANVLLVGVMAAVGEELIFRGILQRHLQSLWSNPHMGIIVASIIFGGIHMQAERLLPLMFLGLLLGYSYHYTKSLWVPIVLHFLNNTMQVTALYISGMNGKPDIDEVPELPIIAVVISFLITLGIAYKASQSRSDLNESRP